LKTKHESFWHQQMDDARGQPRVLWSAFIIVLYIGRGHAPATADAIDATVFRDFFDNEIVAVRDHGWRWST
jgi:hypothetical protein